MTTGNTTGYLRAPYEARRLPLRLMLAALLLLAALAPSASLAHDRGDVPTSPEPELATPGPDAQGTRHIANVPIRSAEDRATMLRLGFPCAESDICEVEVTDAQLTAIEESGLEVTVVGLVAEFVSDARALEDYVYGQNMNNYPIPDKDDAKSKITFTSAPTGAEVTKVKYSCRIETPSDLFYGGPGDFVLDIRPRSFAQTYVVWNQLGGHTDQGHDDDTPDDEDIYLSNRWLYSFYDGHPVNQDWWLRATDKALFNTGTIDYFKLWVYYCVQPSAPTLLSPSQALRHCDTTPSFDWSSVTGASSYRILVDDSSGFASPAINASTTASAYVPSTPLAPGRWYWSVRAQSSCGNSAYSPARYFTIINPPAAPNLLSPSNGAHTCDATPTFDWSTVADASSYAIQVDNSPSFTTP